MGSESGNLESSFTQVVGNSTNLRVKVISNQPFLNTMEKLKMAINMEVGLKFLTMEIDMKGCTQMENLRDWELMHGLMDQFTKGSLKMD